MTTPADLHRQAMDHADRAFAARLKGNHAAAKRSFRKAMQLEAEAADAVESDFDNEPTRSILHRSAATLAIHCDDLDHAEKLAAAGLRGNPPEEIADELRHILEQTNASRHLALRGIVLAPNEIQLSLSGFDIGPGFAPTREVLRRVETTEKILFRRAEQRGGRAPSKRNPFETFLSVPRVASFAVTIRLGTQLELFPDERAAELAIEETIECLTLAVGRDVDGLKRKIANDDYYDNFVALAHQLEPDGRHVRQVSLTAINSQRKERSVSLTRYGVGGVTLIPPRTGPTTSILEIIGHLRFADSTKASQHSVKIVSDEGMTHKIRVPSEMLMADIVRPLWDVKVRVRAKQKGSTLILETIEGLDPIDT